MKTQLKMFRGDITSVDADAIINSSNNDLLLGGGVSGALSRIAGPSVQEECHKIGTIPLGTAAATTAGNLKAQWIIHAAVNPLGLWADAKSVRNAMRAALAKASELGVKRLAIPALGTGTGALPVARSADIILEEVLKHCEADSTPLEEVTFVVYDEKPFAIFDERYRIKVLGEAPPPELPPDPNEDIPLPRPPKPQGRGPGRGPQRGGGQPRRR